MLSAEPSNEWKPAHSIHTTGHERKGIGGREDVVVTEKLCSTAAAVVWPASGPHVGSVLHHDQGRADG